MIDDGTVHALDDGSFRWMVVVLYPRRLRMNAAGYIVIFSRGVEALLVRSSSGQ